MLVARVTPRATERMTNNVLQQSHTPLHSCRFFAVSIRPHLRRFTHHFVYELERPMSGCRQWIKHLQLSTCFTNIFSKCNLLNVNEKIQRLEQKLKGINTHAPCMKLNHVLFVVREQTKTNAMAQRWQQWVRFDLSKLHVTADGRANASNIRMRIVGLAKCESIV